MNHLPLIRGFFVLAALYDGVLGLAFLLAGPAVFAWFEVTPPNHWGYVQFPAALLLVFALMFTALAIDPRANRNLLPYGMLLRVSYSGLVFYHWLATDIPTMWKPFAVADVVFLGVFLWIYVALRGCGETASRTAPHVAAE